MYSLWPISNSNGDLESSLQSLRGFIMQAATTTACYPLLHYRCISLSFIYVKSLFLLEAAVLVLRLLGSE